MPVAVMLLALLFTCSARADEIGLIRITENWRYFKGVQEPSIPMGAWTQPGWDDSGWLQSVGSISTPVWFPATREPTVLPDYSLGYTTVYLRKQFFLSIPDQIDELTLRIDYDDGFVAYLNGEEVVRRGVPGASNVPVPAHTYAAQHSRGFTEEINLSHGLPTLREGPNVLAIQLLGSGSNDTTACLAAELLANLTRAPYVQNTTSNSVQIAWKTLLPSNTMIELGLSQENILQVPVSEGATNHVATLTNLAPDTEYLYRVGKRSAQQDIFTDWRKFRTFKTTGPITFLVMGDSGWANIAQYEIAHQLRETPADFLMHVGDIAYYGFSHYASDFRCLSVYADQMRTVPFFFAWGNHDRYLDQRAMLDTFYLPTNNVTGTEHYYSFDHGDVHFVALWLDLQAGVDYRPGSTQYQWLENDLRNSDKPWKFLFFHHVLRTSSLHWRDDYDRNGILDSVQIEQSIEMLANQYGVQLIFNGHDHNFERFAPSRGTISVVSGGGGAQLYSVAKYHPASVQFHSRYHFLKVDATEKKVSVEAIGRSGEVFDRFQLTRDFPSREKRVATRHSPQVENHPANDQDGNIHWQRCDFLGESIDGKPGKASSAGRLSVNYDAQFLYLGLQELMLTPEQILLIFLETDGRRGVSSMRELGNGAQDPEGEGMDALDFLENVSFTNFSPAIAIVAGDEYGDGVARGFKRPGLTNALGQGAVFLEPAFPAIEGQKLQQFDRSPQNEPFLYEQNANFLEIAIPLNEAGVWPGGWIKVAAVVTLGEPDLISHSIPLDSGGVAQHLWHDQEKVWIEGVLVKLPAEEQLRLAVYAEGGGIKLVWSTVAGKSYQLQGTDRLDHAFRDLEEGFPRTAADGYDVFELSAAETQARYKFFRIVQLP